MDGTTNPFEIATYTGPEYMKEGTTMVPRVFKTMPGDIFTTNTVKDETLAVGDVLVENFLGTGVNLVAAGSIE